MESGIDSSVLSGTVYFSLAVLSLSVVVTFIRVLRGPSLPDRVVAIDFVSYVTMGFLGTYAILSGREAYIDAALVLGLLAFLGTLALARYVEGRSETHRHAGAYQRGGYSAHESVGGVRARDTGRPDQQVHAGGQTKRARRRSEQARSAEQADATEPDATEPDATEPDATEPDATEPENR